MTSARFDPAARESLTSCIREIETCTNAELVLIVRARSGPYHHADYLFGALLAFAGLLILLFSPVAFHEYWVIIDVVLLFVLGAIWSAHSNFLRRLFTTQKFREDAVRRSAAAMFYEAGVANTTSEMGVLVYLSLLERRLELIADRGILKAVPSLEWNEIQFELHEAGKTAQPESLRQALCNLGDLLGKCVPCTAENPNELPDAPHFELR